MADGERRGRSARRPARDIATRHHGCNAVDREPSGSPGTNDERRPPHRPRAPQRAGGSGDPPVRGHSHRRRGCRRGGSPDPPAPTRDRAGDVGGWRTRAMTAIRTAPGESHRPAIDQRAHGVTAATPSTGSRPDHRARPPSAVGPNRPSAPQRAGRTRGSAPTAPLTKRTRRNGGDQAPPDPHPGRGGCA